MNVVYEPEEVLAVLSLIDDNPSGFYRLAQKYCKKVSLKEVERSLVAWGYEPDAIHAKKNYPSRRPSR